MADKTIRQLAAELGAEKSAVEYRRKKLKLGTELDGIIYLSDDEQKLIIAELIGTKKGAESTAENDADYAQKKSSTAELGAELSAQLRSENDYLKDRIDYLEKALQASQVLQKQALDEKKKLEIELDEEQSRGFFQWLFGRKGKSDE